MGESYVAPAAYVAEGVAMLGCTLQWVVACSAGVLGPGSWSNEDSCHFQTAPFTGSRIYFSTMYNSLNYEAEQYCKSTDDILRTGTS